MKATRSASFSSVSTTDACEMPSDRVLAQALDDQRQRETRRPLDLAAHRKHREGRHRNPAIVHQRLGQVLAARQHQAARVASGIGDLHQLEIACDVLVVDDLAVKLLEQRENHMRLEAFDLVAHGLEFVLHAERANLMSGRAQRAHDVVFGFPFIDFLRACTPWSSPGAPAPDASSTRTRRRFIARSICAATGRTARAWSWRSTAR